VCPTALRFVTVSCKRDGNVVTSCGYAIVGMKVIMAYFELGLLYRYLPALGEGNDRES